MARYWETQRLRRVRPSRYNSAPPIRTKANAVSNAILLEKPVEAASEASLPGNRIVSMRNSSPKSLWSSLDRPRRTTTKAHAREIQRVIPSARSSCNNQADTPARIRPTAETGFIATGPGRMPLRSPTASVQPARTMQPTSMAAMLEARERVLREVTSQGMESPPGPGRPAAPCLCLAISYSRYRLFPTPTGLLKRPIPSQDLQQPDAIVLQEPNLAHLESGIRCQDSNQSARRQASPGALSVLQHVSTLPLKPPLVSTSGNQHFSPISSLQVSLSAISISAQPKSLLL